VVELNLRPRLGEEPDFNERGFTATHLKKAGALTIPLPHLSSTLNLDHEVICYGFDLAVSEDPCLWWEGE